MDSLFLPGFDLYQDFSKAYGQDIGLRQRCIQTVVPESTLAGVSMFQPEPEPDRSRKFPIVAGAGSVVKNYRILVIFVQNLP